jgi:hypothetical protein
MIRLLLYVNDLGYGDTVFIDGYLRYFSRVCNDILVFCGMRFVIGVTREIMWLGVTLVG